MQVSINCEIPSVQSFKLSETKYIVSNEHVQVRKTSKKKFRYHVKKQTTSTGTITTHFGLTKNIAFHEASSTFSP